jgi:hypothetical protein
MISTAMHLQGVRKIRIVNTALRVGSKRGRPGEVASSTSDRGMLLVDAEALGDAFHPGRETSLDKHPTAIGRTEPKEAKTKGSITPIGKLGRRVPMRHLLTTSLKSTK